MLGAPRRRPEAPASGSANSIGLTSDSSIGRERLQASTTSAPSRRASWVGTGFVTNPSTSEKSPIATGGNTSGILMLASTASATEPSRM